MVGHHFMLSKPQETGNGLLIRHGEVATTSGSTTFPPVAHGVEHGPDKTEKLTQVQTGGLSACKHCSDAVAS